MHYVTVPLKSLAWYALFSPDCQVRAVVHYFVSNAVPFVYSSGADAAANNLAQWVLVMVNNFSNTVSAPISRRWIQSLASEASASAVAAAAALTASRCGDSASGVQNCFDSQSIDRIDRRRVLDGEL